MVESLVVEFVQKLSGSGALMGSYEQTQRMLNAFLPKEKVETLMEEIRGPAGRNIWDKLANVNETVLASYLKNEYPQTVAVVLAKGAPRARRQGAGRAAGRVRHRMHAAHAGDGAGATRNPRQDRDDAAH